MKPTGVTMPSMKFVLVEGVLGVGKSTLSLELCKRCNIKVEII